MTAKTEAQVIRSQLRLRKTFWDNGTFQGCTYEVWTTIHGSGLFKWIKVTSDDYYHHWQKHFPSAPEEVINWPIIKKENHALIQR